MTDSVAFVERKNRLMRARIRKSETSMYYLLIFDRFQIPLAVEHRRYEIHYDLFHLNSLVS